jgi:F420 biosynthesis protein FbiB-like protein
MWTPTNPDDLHAFLRTRRSIRRFKPDPVPAEVLSRVLATAAYAPSAHNLQPWRFVIVGRIGNPPYEARQRLAHALTSAMRRDMTSAGAPASEIESRVARSIQRIHDAPALLLLCRDVTAVKSDAPEEGIMSIQSVAAAATYLLLAAHAEGLGGNWICWPLYAQKETRQALELPEAWEPQAMVFMGWAEEEPREKTLLPPDKVMRFQ